MTPQYPLSKIKIADSTVAGRSTFVPSVREHPTMADVAVEELRDAILSGQLAPGEPLRLERLAESLGMSISPVRDAVRRLVLLGYAEQTPRKGARVSQLSPEELADIYEVRLALERIAVRRAALEFGDTDAQRAAERLQELDEAYEREDALAILRANKSFHLSLYEASRSEFLLRQIESTWENSDRYRAWIFSGSGMASIKQIEREGHELILEACIRNDPDAAVDALDGHLAVFIDIVMERLPVPSTVAT